MLSYRFRDLLCICFDIFFLFSPYSPTFQNTSLFHVIFCSLPSCFSFISLNCFFSLFLFNSYLKSHFLLHLIAWITLSHFCCEYFATGNFEHHKVSCHLSTEEEEAVLCSICCLAICFSGVFSCTALWSKLQRQVERKIKMGLKNTAIKVQHLLQHDSE